MFEQQFIKKPVREQQAQQIMARPPPGHMHMPHHIFRQRKKIPIDLSRK